MTSAMFSFLLSLSFPAILDHSDLGVDFGVKVSVDKEGEFGGFVNIEPIPKAEAVFWRYSPTYEADFKLYSLPFTHKTKPVLQGKLGPVPFPATKLTLPFNQRTINGPTNLDHGRYVLELTVESAKSHSAFKAVFFSVRGEWFCWLGCASIFHYLVISQ